MIIAKRTSLELSFFLFSFQNFKKPVPAIFSVLTSEDEHCRLLRECFECSKYSNYILKFS